MIALVAMLAATVTALMLVVKQFEAQLKPPTDADQLAQFQQRLDLFNLLFSMALGVVGALAFVYSTPGVFANDPILISSNPVPFAVFAGLIAVLPGGAGTTVLSAILTWLGAMRLGAQAVKDMPAPRHTLALWG